MNPGTSKSKSNKIDKFKTSKTSKLSLDTKLRPEKFLVVCVIRNLLTDQNNSKRNSENQLTRNKTKRKIQPKITKRRQWNENWWDMLHLFGSYSWLCCVVARLIWFDYSRFWSTFCCPTTKTQEKTRKISQKSWIKSTVKSTRPLWHSFRMFFFRSNREKFRRIYHVLY